VVSDVCLNNGCFDSYYFFERKYSYFRIWRIVMVEQSSKNFGKDSQIILIREWFYIRGPKRDMDEKKLVLVTCYIVFILRKKIMKTRWSDLTMANLGKKEIFN